MAQKTYYDQRVDPQQVDFTRRATLAALADAMLNVAGVDAQRKGFGVDALNRDDCSWVLSRMAFELDRRPEQFTSYRIATWISDYGRLLSTRNFTLEDAAGTLFGRAVTQWCMIDLAARTPVDLTLVCQRHAEAMVAEPSPAEKPRKVLGVHPTERTEHRVVYSDIDFNRHVNTLRYLDMICDMLPLERFAEDAPVRLDIHFMHECRYGQTLSVGREQRDGLDLFEIASDDGTVAVRASLGRL